LDPVARTNGRALWSPTTSSVDPQAVVASLGEDARAAGIDVRTGEAFVAARDGEVETTTARYTPGYLVNAAGAYADRVARHFGFAEHHRILPFKGRYLRATVDPGVRRHLYPVPDLRYPFLGVHSTVAVDGTVWIGPTAGPLLGKEQYGWAMRPAQAVRTGWGLARLLTMPHKKGLRRLALKEVRRLSYGRIGPWSPRPGSWPDRSHRRGTGRSRTISCTKRTIGRCTC